jgi:hypothetical protein
MISVALPFNANTSDVDAFRRLRTATASEWKESSSTATIFKFHRSVLANPGISARSVHLDHFSAFFKARIALSASVALSNAR